MAAGGEAASSLSLIEIRENSEDQIVLEAAASTADGKELRTAYVLSRGRVFVECKPLQNAARIRIEAATRFAVLPDFFGADMVFDPRAYAQPRLVLPSENFVLNLLEGEKTIVMSVWPTGNQEAELILAGRKRIGAIEATEIGFGGKSVYAAILHVPGIWHEHKLPQPSTDRDIVARMEEALPGEVACDSLARGAEAIRGTSRTTRARPGCTAIRGCSGPAGSTRRAALCASRSDSPRRRARPTTSSSIRRSGRAILR